MAEQRRPMARQVRHVALVVTALAFAFPFLAFTGLRALAQAPDYDEFAAPADTDLTRDEFSVSGDSEVEHGDCLVPPDTAVAGAELLLGAPDPFVQIVQPMTVPWAMAIDTSTSLVAVAFPEGGELTWSATGPGEVTFGEQETMLGTMFFGEEAYYRPSHTTRPCP